VEKYGTDRQATDDIIRRKRLPCWITKATDTHSGYVIIYCFSPAKMVWRTRLIVMFIRTLPLHFACYLQAYYGVSPRWSEFPGIPYHPSQHTVLMTNGPLYLISHKSRDADVHLLSTPPRTILTHGGAPVLTY